MRIKVIRGDITKQEVDVIVNAGNHKMLGGGGVDGAIHRAAGPGLLLECRTLGHCDTGDCRVTKAYNLPAKHIVHTVGPVWIGWTEDEKNKKDEQLTSCYRRCLEEAAKLGAETVAFPSISTGAYGFPVRRAARVAHNAVNDFLEANETIKTVTFVCWQEDDYNAHMELHG